MEVRRAEILDVPILSRIHALSWKKAYIGMVPQAYLDQLQEDFWISKFEEWLSQGLSQALIVYDKKQAAGCVVYGESRDCALPNWGEISNLYLLPEYYGRGCGEALLKAAMADLLRMGYRDVFLWVLRENARARRFYKKQGFTETEDILEVEIMGKTLIDYRCICQRSR